MNLIDIANCAIEAVHSEMETAQDASFFSGVKQFMTERFGKGKPHLGTLEEHDKRFHPNGYKDGGRCKFREKLDKDDEVDAIPMVENSNIPKNVSIEGADITKFDGDAIVNAANRWMLGGGGVDGAIHRAAGPELLEECKKYPPDENGYRVLTGEAKITGAGDLNVKHVIHTAGPDVREFADKWKLISDEDKKKIAELLSNSYKNSLELAKKHGDKKVAFPSISTGIFGYPVNEASKVVAKTVSSFLKDNPNMSVKMCIFDPNPDKQKEIIDAYQNAFREVSTKKGVSNTTQDEDNAQVAQEADGDDITMNFKFYVDTAKYAMKFDVKLPDDSMDAVLTGEEGKNEGDTDEKKVKSEEKDDKGDKKTTDASPFVEGVSMDTGVSYFGNTAQWKNTCKATLAQCKAKNPMTCRYHGTLVLAQDIDNFLKSQGIKGGVSVSFLGVNKSGGKEILSVSVDVTSKKKDEAAIKAAMDKFYASTPGVSGDKDDVMYDSSDKKTYAPFDIDLIDPNLPAQWGFGQPSPTATQAPINAQTAPQNTATPQTSQQTTTKKAKTKQNNQNTQQNTQSSTYQAPAQQTPTQSAQGQRLRPEVRPPEPPAWNGLVQDDFSFLDSVSLNLAYIAQRVNHNINKNDPSKLGAGTVALTNFKDIDIARLTNLVSKDSTGQVSSLKNLYDAVVASEKNGWADLIEMNGYKYDDSKCNSSDPGDSTGYNTWKFDSSKCPKDPNGKARKAWAEWEDPAKKRDVKVKGFSHIKQSTAKDAPIKEIEDMEKANEDMKDIESNIQALDNAIANEKDPNAKKDLEDALAAVEMAYYDANQKFSDNEKAVSKWVNNQQTMHYGYSYADAMDYYTSRGLDIPAFLKNMEQHAKKMDAVAEQQVAKRFKNRKGWQTHAERLQRIEQLRKNWATLLPHIHIYHRATPYINTSIIKDGSVRANVRDNNYKDAMKNAFGASRSSLKAKDMQLYTVMSIEDNPAKCGWTKYYDYVVEADTKKSLGGVVYGNGCGYWDGYCNGAAMNILSQISFCDINYNDGNNNFNPESAELDFTKMTPTQMFECMFPGGSSSMECHLGNGISIAQGNFSKVWCGNGAKLLKATEIELSKHNVPVLTF